MKRPRTALPSSQVVFDEEKPIHYHHCHGKIRLHLKHTFFKFWLVIKWSQIDDVLFFLCIGKLVLPKNILWNQVTIEDERLNMIGRFLYDAYISSIQTRFDKNFKLWNVAKSDFSKMMPRLPRCPLGIGRLLGRNSLAMNHFSFAFQVK